MGRQVYHYYDYKPSARHNTAAEGNTYCTLHFNLFAVVLSSGTVLRSRYNSVVYFSYWYLTLSWAHGITGVGFPSRKWTEEYAAIRDELYLNLIFYIMQLNLSYILYPSFQLYNQTQQCIT